LLRPPHESLVLFLFFSCSIHFRVLDRSCFLAGRRHRDRISYFFCSSRLAWSHPMRLPPYKRKVGLPPYEWKVSLPPYEWKRLPAYEWKVSLPPQCRCCPQNVWFLCAAARAVFPGASYQRTYHRCSKILSKLLPSQLQLSQLQLRLPSQLHKRHPARMITNLAGSASPP